MCILAIANLFTFEKVVRFPPFKDVHISSHVSQELPPKYKYLNEKRGGDTVYFGKRNLLWVFVFLFRFKKNHFDIIWREGHPRNYLLNTKTLSRKSERERPLTKIIWTLHNQHDYFKIFKMVAIKVECGIRKPILSLEPNCIYWPDFLSDPNSARKVKCL